MFPGLKSRLRRATISSRLRLLACRLGVDPTWISMVNRKFFLLCQTGVKLVRNGVLNERLLFLQWTREVRTNYTQYWAWCCHMIDSVLLSLRWNYQKVLSSSLSKYATIYWVNWVCNHWSRNKILPQQTTTWDLRRSTSLTISYNCEIHDAIVPSARQIFQVNHSKINFVKVFIRSACQEIVYISPICPLDPPFGRWDIITRSINILGQYMYIHLLQYSFDYFKRWETYKVSINKNI